MGERGSAISPRLVAWAGRSCCAKRCGCMYVGRPGWSNWGWERTEEQKKRRIPWV